MQSEIKKLTKSEKKREFGKALLKKEENKFVGKSPLELAGEINKHNGTMDEIRNIVRKAVAEVGLDRKEDGKKTRVQSSTYIESALAKYKESLAKEDNTGVLGKLSLTDFAKLVVVDDIPSILSGLASGAITVMKHPVVREGLERLAEKGFSKLSHLLFGIKEKTSDGYSMERVSLDYLQSSFTQQYSPCGDPIDVPLPVYVNRFTKSYSVTCNINGDGLFVIQAQNGASSASNVNNRGSFFTFDNRDLYDPDTAAVPVFSALGGISPLVGSFTLIDQFKPLGLNVHITPTVSSLANQGKYLVCTLQRGLQDGSLMFWDKATTFDTASQMVGADVYDMKTSSVTRAYPELMAWRIKTDTLPTTPDIGGFTFIMVSGAASYASLQITVSLPYSILPTEDGLALIRGSVQPMGFMTKNFENYLRVTKTDFYKWPDSKVNDYFEKLRRVENKYTSLVKV